MRIVDTHSHLFVDEFKDDLPEVIARSKESGVSQVVMPNIDDTTVEQLLRVSSAHAGYCFPLIGLHPTSVDRDYAQRLSRVRHWLEVSDIFIGIGEIGLDYYWDATFRNEQLLVFKEQLRWAAERNWPVAIHCRNAFDDLCEVMSECCGRMPLRGVFHSFSGTAEEARRLLSFDGFYLGINGIATFKKSTLPEALKEVPLERIVLETDSPYLAPVPFRGKRNESAYLPYILIKVSEACGLPPEEVAAQSTANAEAVFSL